jgi:Ca2+-binding EF-hand superfamily protein
MNKKYSSVLAIIVSAAALAGTAAAGGGQAHGGKDRMTKLDANKDGKVTLAELTQSKQSWLAEVDTNKDGSATTAELEAHSKARREKHVQELFQRKDSNHDGRLSREESGMPERWFDRNDENKDGALTPAELASGRSKGHKGGKHERDGRAGGKHARLDANGDGKIDRAEVTQSAAQMLQRLDKNTDGTLSAEEVSARHKGPHHGGKRGRGPAGERG